MTGQQLSTVPQSGIPSMNQSPLRPTPLSSIQQIANVSMGPGNSIVPPDSNHPNAPVGFLNVSGSTNSSSNGSVTNNSNNNSNNQTNAQGLPMQKSQKKRKEGGVTTMDYESSSSNRDDVQSPAYSDISDDSTPVVETEMISGKLNKYVFSYFGYCIYL